ncbi:deleted in lung and esophageal cancer protein 1 isoform X2 [Osmerus eperlanus]|uniref:deleted in lung and esophageal cancer protein 1 isoform X2 n=1 Tax=Osmerus eperlanus TaxID=29151 RepID=UPI002E11367E
MNRHRPASEKTQDISHLLASIFEDVYITEIIGKDTVANLTKTRRGGNTHHDKYVEDLQQVHSEHRKRMRDADMLENHIIQARVQATATESQVHDTVVEEMGVAYHHLGLPAVKSTFMWCVNNGVLASNNLICPQDYIVEQAPLGKAPRAKSTRGFTNPTTVYNKHVCNRPKNDDFTVILSTDRTVRGLLEESETTLTRTSSPVSFFAKCKTKEEASTKSQTEERITLQKLKDRCNLCDPRYLSPHAQKGSKSLVLPRKVDKMLQGEKHVAAESSTDQPVPVFLASPPLVFFTDYRVGHVYETTVELRNLTTTSRYVRVLPPTTTHFSISLGRFPGEGGIVAPGMSCQYTVRFAPDSLADFEDFLVVETQAQYPLLVPIVARRPPPVLTLPSVLECGYCLVGGVKFVEFLCCNEGLSAGTFCIMPKSQWPTSNLRSVVKTSFAEQPPFGVTPSLFELQPGQTAVVEVVFFPTTAESCSQVFTIVCDNCQVKDITIQGEGQLVLLELVSVLGEEECPAQGELCDLTAEHHVRFGPVNPHSVQQKKLVIKNNTCLELPFYWQIMKPNLQSLLPGENPDTSHIHYHLAIDLGFYVSPTTGILAPLQEHEFLLTYNPQELKDYNSVCHLVLKDIPDPPKEPSNDWAPHTLNTAAETKDVIVMAIDVKGTTEPYQILLEPYSIHIPGELFIGTTINRKFKMWNNSKSLISFKWERKNDYHIMEVMPPSGEIEAYECFDLELVLTGGRAGKVAASLQCQIKNHNKSVTLNITATFKGPHLSLSVPSVDLGLLRLGDQAQSKVTILNPSQLEACWTLRELANNLSDKDTQITVEPYRGVLPPLASHSIHVLFRPKACQHFETILELVVEHGTGCHLLVQADVQSPQVCLLSCELIFLELYVEVPAKTTVTMFNQTLLPAQFTWIESPLHGRQASLCSATFNPSTGTLGPNAKMEITVTFTAHTELELTEVAAVCEVKGMKELLILGFLSKAKKLYVSHSLPGDCSMSDDMVTSPLVLDFGDVILRRAVTKQLIITNHTAIPAPFNVEVEYFTGYNPSKLAGQSHKRASHMRRPLHSIVKTMKVEEKEHEKFVSRLLADGKGLAFFVQPDSGMLGSFETKTIDITAFTNMWGEYQDQLISKVGDLPAKPISMQITVRGCPLYFQMIGPQPENQNKGPIIRFGNHVSGGDTVSRSLRLINTSPFDILMDWESYNLMQGDMKLLDVVVACGDAFPLKDADGNEVVDRTDSPPTWNCSHTPSSDGKSSSLSSQFREEIITSDEDETVDVKGTLYPTAENKKLFSVFIIPHEGNAADYPYCITPQQIVVPAGGSSTIHVSFTPLTITGMHSNPDCVGFALGFMSLDFKVASCVSGKVQRAQGRDLKPLRLNLQASVRPAVLSVQMEKGEETMEFYAVASDLLLEDTGTEMAVQKDCAIAKYFTIKNTTEMPLGFRLSTQAPFTVLLVKSHAQTESHSSTQDRTASIPTGDDQFLVLQPQHNMQVKVAFHCSLSLLAYLRQPTEEAPSSVTLMRSDNGERKLRFHQNLKVHYRNNSLQNVPLCATLVLPTVHLSCPSIDFGTCYVGQAKLKEVYLHNHGISYSYWRATIDPSDEKSDVFRVTPDCGVLKPQEFPVSTCRQVLQVSFTASDKMQFQATVTIQGVLGEPNLTLQLQGMGSYDERHTSPPSHS